jgi:hypothetical protein
MSATVPLASPLPKNSLSTDPSKILSALWGLRLVLNQYGSSQSTDVSILSSAWLNLVGDCVEWPLDLLAEFIKVSSEEDGEVPESRLRRKQYGSPISWYSAFNSFKKAYTKQPERLNKHFQKSINKLGKHWLSIRDQDSVWKNITMLGDQLHLSELERIVLIYLVNMGCNRPLRNFFQDFEFVSIIVDPEIRTIV